MQNASGADGDGRSFWANLMPDAVAAYEEQVMPYTHPPYCNILTSTALFLPREIHVWTHLKTAVAQISHDL